MAWTFAQGTFGMYRVGQIQGKTFIPIAGFLTASEAALAVNSLNNITPYVPPAPLPVPPPGSLRFGKASAKAVSAKVMRKLR
jgi:hypothetical protein